MKNLITLLFILISFSSQATVITWGGSIGDWNVAANWVGGVIPTASDEVYINGGEVTIPSNYTTTIKFIEILTAKLMISSSGALIIDGRNAANYGIRNYISSTIINHGSINIDNAYKEAISNTYNSLFINKKTGNIIIGETSSNQNGISNSFESKFINYNHISLINISGNGIINLFENTIFKNYGVIDMITGAIGSNGIYNSLSALYLNNGTINIDNTQNPAISNIGATFKNLTSGFIIIGDSFVAHEGIYNFLSGDFRNRGSISITNTTICGIRNHSSSLFVNTKTGTINIGGSLSTSTGIYNSAGASMNNLGEITIENPLGTSITNVGNSTINNSSCGTLTLLSEISTSGNNFNNYGLLSQNYSGVNYSDALTFINNGIIEDIQGSFDPASMVNNGYLVAPITASVYENIALQSVLIGTGTGLTFSTNYFYTDNTLNTEAGGFMQLNNTWTPNANAVNHDIFYMEIDNGSGCPRIVEIHTNNPVSLVRHEGGENDIKQTHVPKSISKAVEVGYSVYPNPSAGTLILKSSHTIDESIEIFISNVNGQVVFQKAFDQLNTKTSILEGNSNFPPGIYFLMVKQNGEIVGQEKVVFY